MPPVGTIDAAIGAFAKVSPTAATPTAYRYSVVTGFGKPGEDDGAI
jgi:hypothetical protein